MTVRSEKKELEDLIEEEDEEPVDNNDNISDLDNDGEEVKKIAGKGITKSDKADSDDLILHLVSTSLSNIHEK